MSSKKQPPPFSDVYKKWQQNPYSHTISLGMWFANHFLSREDAAGRLFVEKDPDYALEMIKEYYLKHQWPLE